MDRVLREEGIREGEIGVVFVDNEYIRGLNRTYAKVDSVTDVLAFSMQEGEGGKFSHGCLGEVYVSWDKAVQQAEEYEVPLESELYRLVIHGVLHLLGYEHGNKDSAAVMKKKEEHFLKLALESGKESGGW